ncbi:hypothetical protein TSA6c_16920 [Azospirillum sp. TSA6c]|uniref:MucR family transcriptional regulator n=1 Tax=Azospirillum sp. TSA6c TaxID=709813 RepID=UPI000D60575D|nr:MucR family transcriptional regulator [Azospirillum sp. TSA6c]PWC48119.1 hypothetical protein TSA6c_16920 [Azospirillum sp. TSA6c]
METNAPVSKVELTELTAKIVAAYVSKNTLPHDQLPAVISTVYSSIANAGQPQITVVEASSKPPAVPIKKSVAADFIICLEDGKKLKMLKRYLRTTYNLSPEEYRAKWGLPPEYPMVAPNYAKARSEMAINLGLGRKAGSNAPRRAA